MGEYPWVDLHPLGWMRGDDSGFRFEALEARRPLPSIRSAAPASRPPHGGPEQPGPCLSWWPMDLLLVALLIAASLALAGWAAVWALAGSIIAAGYLLGSVFGLLRAPFARSLDPRSKGRALKLEVLLSTRPGAT